MDDYLVKPLSLSALAAVLNRWSPDGAAQDVFVDAPDVPTTVASPASDQVDGRSIIDPSVTERLERLGAAAGEDLLGRLTTLYLADADGQILALRDALAADDVPGMVRPAHKLSGASANLGAADLARMCATLASDGAAGDLTGGTRLFHEIEAELERVRFALLARVART